MTTPDTDNSISVHEALSDSGTHIHLLGICGIGMAGLAVLLKSRGFRVSGCDTAYGATGEWLTAHGVSVEAGHDAAHITDDISWIIRSPAVALNCVELETAYARNLPVFKRGEVLPALLSGMANVIAVAGTHGKTSVSSFIAQILQHCGREPGFCIGGVSEPLAGVAAEGGGNITVVEADESDGTVAFYTPHIGVVTNIEADHMENFKDPGDLPECFERFVGGTTGIVVYCADDTGASAVCEKVENRLSYGLSRNTDLQAVDIELTAIDSSFTVKKKGELMGRVVSPVAGHHNVLNLLAAIAVCMEVALEFEEIADALTHLCAVQRRFERIVECPDITVISDYAHHPTEISALMRTVQLMNSRRVRAVFQPHRYSRTLAFGENFTKSFDGVDELILLPVYSASEQPISGGTVWDLYAKFRDSGTGPQSIAVAESREQAWEYLRQTASVGDVIVIAGAGDVHEIAETAALEWGQDGAKWNLGTGCAGMAAELKEILPSSEVKVSEPIGGKTTLHVGGCADIWVKVDDVADFSRLSAWCSERHVPLHVFGGGSNVLVSDLGVRGVCARLTGVDFKSLKVEHGVVTAGAGVTLKRLLNWCTEHELGGLEFLEGIPGTVGGAVRMNAGAWGDEICKYLAWVKCVDENGEVTALTDLQSSYRQGIDNGSIVSVGLAVRDLPGEEGRNLRQRAAERRGWMKGLRSAGSVFMNPGDDFAGRLLEQCEMKGQHVGGAKVSRDHANMIVVGDDASASDVRALMERMRSKVLLRFGIRLKEEIVILE